MSQTEITQAPTKGEIVKSEKQMPLLAGIQAQIVANVNSGRIHFPPDFNQANAMVSAKVALIEGGFIDVNGNPTGKVTQTSLVNAVYDSMVQGCNVSKDQGYYIGYNGVMAWQRSYHGDALVAKRASGFKIEPYYDVIYKGEDFKTKKMMTSKGLATVIVEHVQPFPRTSTEIIGAYCGCVDNTTGEDYGIELMSILQIHTSWKASKTWKKGKETFHDTQPDKACLRTVIRRWATPIYNASDDRELMASIKRQEAITQTAEIEAIEAEVSTEIQENANKEPLSLASEAEAASASVEGAQEPEPAETGTEGPEQPKAQHAPQRRERI